MKTMTINGIARLVQFGEARNIPAVKLLHGTGIQEWMLKDPSVTVTSEQEFAVIRNLQRRFDSDHLGLLVGENYPLSVLGVLGVAVPYSETVRQAIHFFLRYIALSYTYFGVEFVEKADSAVLILTDKVALEDLRRFFIDRDAMFVLKVFREHFPQYAAFGPVSLHLGYEKPADITIYQKTFQCPVTFGIGATRLVMPKMLLDLALPQSNPLTLKLLEQSCADIDQKLKRERTLSDRVREHLIRHIQSPPSVETIAAEFCQSVRTLRRQLSQEGGSYQQILNEVRSAEAKKLLTETEWTIAEISACLGYSESASFIHAFKNWNQLSPRQYRMEGRSSEAQDFQ